MIDKEALEEEPIGALIREVQRDIVQRQPGIDLIRIAAEADRRDREWRRLYASMRERKDAALEETEREGRNT